MSWSVVPDVHTFLAAAAEFLEARPVDHTMLLTEAAYLGARSGTEEDQRYGWWRNADGAVAGAFLQAPRHPPILSLLPTEAIASLVDILPAGPLGVDGRIVDEVIAGWRERTGTTLDERSRIRVYRLDRLNGRSHPDGGRARTATPTDRDLLVAWYHELMARYPDDPSDVAYVVDDPISYGGITLWETDNQPVAMAMRSRLVAGMVRIGAAHSPHDEHFAEAAFIAACASALEVARDVLALASAGDTAADAAYRALGFAPLYDRVLLTPR